MDHLVVYKRKGLRRDYVQLMFDGDKTLDIKFSNRRVPPFNTLNKGDHMYIKESSGPVVGRCTITDFKYFDFQQGGDMLALLMEHGEKIGIESEEEAIRLFEKRSGYRYMTLFQLDEPIALPHPIRVEKHDMRVWVANYQLPLELRLAFGLEGEEITRGFTEELEVSDEDLRDLDSGESENYMGPIR